MLSRLTISLAQLKAAINLEKLKNEIRQPLYSVYSSKNQKKPPKNKTKTIKPWQFDQYYLKMETIFMNTENSKTNESNKVFMNLLISLILKIQIKTLQYLM